MRVTIADLGESSRGSHNSGTRHLKTRRLDLVDMPPIVIDTREKRPYSFQNSIRSKLELGDYSLLGYENRVAIERKSLQDAYRSIGSERVRFHKEVESLSELEFSAIVVEATLCEFLEGPKALGLAQDRMNPKAAVHSLLSWSIEFGVHVHFVGGRVLSRGVVYHLLRHFWRRSLLNAETETQTNLAHTL